jgi:hypothetical protein
MRTVTELIGYAIRLHQSDPKGGEPIPVTREEYEAVTELTKVSSRTPLALSASFSDLKLMGHPLKVL